MSIDFLLVFFVARYLRKSLNTKETAPDWDNKLKVATYVGIGLFAASFAAGSYSTLLTLVADAILLWLVYAMYTNEFFKSARSIFIAIAPFIIVSLLSKLIQLILPGFYKDWKSIIDNVNVFAIIWGVGVWIVNAKQRKELDKAQEKVVAEKRNSTMMAAMKAELEVQVAERTAELTKQKEELEHTLTELRSTQTQLVQSEKMASLGELTAGIAHEIQNPLNFVNNFSEVNKEMVDEVAEEINKGNYDEAKIILNDIKENSEKINHHGKRADAIVKGMLQHSRTSSGQKELTDINDLCDEYLRLAFHGLRAKDKTFNAEFKTDFDDKIGKINIIPQDVGRVLLNLINNAFYAVNEKRKESVESYKPQVTVETVKGNGKINIIVKDNGNGVPESIKDKIFQPFFTTKPTGQGTGLGLSLAYDIIKAHNGEIKVESEQGVGTKFIIMLPA